MVLRRAAGLMYLLASGFEAYVRPSCECMQVEGAIKEEKAEKYLFAYRTKKEHSANLYRLAYTLSAYQRVFACFRRIIPSVAYAMQQLI